MEPMLWLVAFESMQRELEERQRFRLACVPLGVAERRRLADATRPWLARLRRPLVVRRTAPLPAAGDLVACCPA